MERPLNTQSKEYWCMSIIPVIYLKFVNLYVFKIRYLIFIFKALSSQVSIFSGESDARNISGVGYSFL